jgi:hypothetical protein
MKTTNRRKFLSGGASLLVTAASFLMFPKAYAMTPVGRDHYIPQASLTGGVVPTMEPSHDTAEDMDRCVQLCQDCHALCTRTMKHCLDLGGRHSAPELVRLLDDCAQMCVINVDYMLRGSVLHERVCGVCAEACRLCADICRPIAKEDKMLRQCIDLCRRCAESCERMASTLAA